jgi:FkbM family methyltransferase
MRVKLMIKNIVSNLLYLIPNKARYEICRHHANKEFGENRSDFNTNGELWILKTILPEIKTVFDVGSHVGQWATYVLRMNPNIDLHCFEPGKRPFQVLQQKGFKKNVICNNFGLGSENAFKKLYVYEDLSEGSSLYLRKGLENIVGTELQAKTEDVEIRTLDCYCKEKDIRKIDFIKIDVEGNELDVIKGGKEYFEHERIKMAQFEYGGSYIDSRILLKDFFDFFEDMNYNIFLLYPTRVRKIPRYDQRLENFQYKNFLIVNHKAEESHKFLRL